MGGLKLFGQCPAHMETTHFKKGLHSLFKLCLLLLPGIICPSEENNRPSAFHQKICDNQLELFLIGARGHLFLYVFFRKIPILCIILLYCIIIVLLLCYCIIIVLLYHCSNICDDQLELLIIGARRHLFVRFSYYVTQMFHFDLIDVFFKKIMDFLSLLHLLHKR